MAGLERDPKWGLGDCMGGIAVAFLASLILQILVISIWSGSSYWAKGAKHVSPEETLVVAVVGLVGIWIGLGGAAVRSANKKSAAPGWELVPGRDISPFVGDGHLGVGGTRGTWGIASNPGQATNDNEGAPGSLKERLRINFGLSAVPLDIPLGLALGVGCQLILIPILYLPFVLTDRHLKSELSKPARQLVGGYHGWDLAIIALFVVVGAPIVEEIFFRGLLLRSIFRAVQSRSSSNLSAVTAVLVSSLVFALAHYEALQFLGLAATGAVFGIVAYKTGRIGPTIVAHFAFNATAVVALAINH